MVSRSSFLIFILLLSGLIACDSEVSGGNAFEGQTILRKEPPKKLIPTVGLRTDSGRKCSGLFIGDDLLVTAWSCIAGARGVSVISLSFRDRPASQTFLTHPDLRLKNPSSHVSTTPGLEIALIKMPKPIASQEFIAPLAAAPIEEGESVFLEGFQHPTSRFVKDGEGVIYIGRNKIASIDAANEDLLFLDASPQGSTADQALPLAEDLGSPLFNANHELVGIVREADDGQASYVNLQSEKLQTFIEAQFKSSRRAGETSESAPEMAFVPKCSLQSLGVAGSFTLEFQPGDTKMGSMKLVRGNGFSCKNSKFTGPGQFYPTCAKVCAQDNDVSGGEWGWCKGVNAYSCLM